ncbi:MAG: hypothetical protein R3330_03725 [Saprospiraceae bacterium]|nr:hypothetical protein [Saprospiraceae bacterium]
MRSLLLAFFLLATLASCTDGVQIASEINGIIEERAKDKVKDNDITSVKLIRGARSAVVLVDSLRLDGQFVVTGDTLVNLMWVEEIRVSGTSIELQFK